MTKPTALQARRSGQSFHPTHYLRVFYKRRWVAIPGFLLVFLSGAVDSVRTVPIYQSSAQLMIEKPRAGRRASPACSRSATPGTTTATCRRSTRSCRAALSGRVVQARETRFRPEHVPPSPSSRSAWAGCSARRDRPSRACCRPPPKRPPRRWRPRARSRDGARAVGGHQRVPGRPDDRADSRVEPRRNPVSIAGCRIRGVGGQRGRQSVQALHAGVAPRRVEGGQQLARRSVEGTAGQGGHGRSRLAAVQGNEQRGGGGRPPEHRPAETHRDPDAGRRRGSSSSASTRPTSSIWR